MHAEGGHLVDHEQYKAQLLDAVQSIEVFVDCFGQHGVAHGLQQRRGEVGMLADERVEFQAECERIGDPVVETASERRGQQTAVAGDHFPAFSFKIEMSQRACQSEHLVHVEN